MDSGWTIKPRLWRKPPHHLWIAERLSMKTKLDVGENEIIDTSTLRLRASHTFLSIFSNKRDNRFVPSDVIAIPACHVVIFVYTFWPANVQEYSWGLLFVSKRSYHLHLILRARTLVWLQGKLHFQPLTHLKFSKRPFHTCSLWIVAFQCELEEKISWIFRKEVIRKNNSGQLGYRQLRQMISLLMWYPRVPARQSLTEALGGVVVGPVVWSPRAGLAIFRSKERKSRHDFRKVTSCGPPLLFIVQQLCQPVVVAQKCGCSQWRRPISI